MKLTDEQIMRMLREHLPHAYFNSPNAAIRFARELLAAPVAADAAALLELTPQQVNSIAGAHAHYITPVSWSFKKTEMPALARAFRAASGAPAAAAPSEDAYVAQRMTETLAEVYATIIGADAQQEDESLNAIERVKRAAQVLRLEVDLYRAQRNEAAAVQPDERAAFEAAYEKGYSDGWSHGPYRATAPQATVRGDEQKTVAWMTLDCVRLKPASVYLDKSEVEGMRPEHIVELVPRAAVPQSGALTDERIAHIAAAHTNSVIEFDRLLKFARAILATHPEGNRTPIDGDRPLETGETE